MNTFLKIPAVPPTPGNPGNPAQIGRPEMLVNVAAVQVAKWHPDHQGGELWIVLNGGLDTIKVRGAAASALWERLQALDVQGDAQPSRTPSSWGDPNPRSEAEARRRVVTQLAGDAAARAQVGVIAPGIVQRLARLGQELDDVGAALFEAPHTAAPAMGLPQEEARKVVGQLQQAGAALWRSEAPSAAGAAALARGVAAIADELEPCGCESSADGTPLKRCPQHGGGR